MPRSSPSPRTLFILTVLAMLVLALGPVKYTGWVRVLRNPVDVIIRPVSGPMSALSTWLRPARQSVPGLPSDGNQTDEATEIERQRDEFKWLYLREVDRSAELEALVRDLQGGAGWSRPPGVRRIEGQRVGSDLSAGTIDVARGSNDGVRPGAVVVARRSEQIVGVATDIRANVTSFRLITDKNLQPRNVVGVIVPEGPLTSTQLSGLPRCQLRPMGDGTLVDQNVKIDTGLIEPGMIVRLADDTWPDAARMLVLGRVVRVEQADNPLFRRVIVRPDLDITRVNSVIVQSPGDPPQAEPAGTTGGTPPPGGGGNR